MLFVGKHLGCFMLSFWAMLSLNELAGPIDRRESRTPTDLALFDVSQNTGSQRLLNAELLQGPEKQAERDSGEEWD